MNKHLINKLHKNVRQKLSLVQTCSIIFIRGVHGYTDEGGELKNKWKGVFEEALVKLFSKKFQNEAT